MTPGSVTTGFTPDPALSVTKSGAMPVDVEDGEDITYTVTVTNTGNVTMTGVVPTDPGPTFNGAAGTGTMSAFSPAGVTLAMSEASTRLTSDTLNFMDFPLVGDGDPTGAGHCLLPPV